MTSYLEIYTLATGERQVVLETEDHIEAPNFTRDGAALIVNGGGRLYRVTWDAEVPALSPIDTGFATALNNDHGLSPDGRTLAISHKTDGESCIYTLPLEGGTPVRVTEKTPSYWHGWSPDGAQIAYTAKREGSFSIHVSAVDGSGETRLTGEEGHDDGPDYTRDGAWIWFNSDRSGAAQLWRVRPDGTDLQQMTRESSVNWFPHPSPTEDHVLYLAYPEGTTGHPPGKDVALKLLDPESGESRELVRLYGGQGTINVPCWHPDGRRFAFVRYA
ncbi:TolB family protein [Pseudoroseicyclus aestuarii]|uniref:WD40 repeat protein n=1 Tax=Pseudoroseicyclus aestuarii TaxID=1795041 RepID=A0A318SSR7_9RHOB|nr:TolB family protein [Pseudoroseicyclus aestuarii]PYE82322.1 WD40 repeat protein [Pseudoroseicyclus aestuarii]